MLMYRLLVSPHFLDCSQFHRDTLVIRRNESFILILVVRLSLWPHETSCAVESYVLIRINFQGQYFPLLCLIVVDVKIGQNSDGKSVFIIEVRVGFTQQVNELFSLKGLIALVNEFYSNEMSVG